MRLNVHVPRTATVGGETVISQTANLSTSSATSTIIAITTPTASIKRAQCPKDYKMEARLGRHLASHRGVHDEAYYLVTEARCPSCRRPFARIDAARDHVGNTGCSKKVTNPLARRVTGGAIPKPPKKRHQRPEDRVPDPPPSSPPEVL